MKRELKILLLTSSLFMFAGGLFGPLYAVFVEGIGGNLLTAGSAYSVFAVAAGASIFFISKYDFSPPNFFYYFRLNWHLLLLLY